MLAAVGEAATGFVLPIVPSLVGQLLFGEELTDIAIPVARVTGIALIAWGVACWPRPPRFGMLIYSAAVTLYLAYIGITHGLTGALLRPAIALARDPGSTSDLGINDGEGKENIDGRGRTHLRPG